MNKNEITQEQLDQLVRENKRLKREKKELLNDWHNGMLTNIFLFLVAALGMYLAITTQTEVEQLQQIITQLTV